MTGLTEDLFASDVALEVFHCLHGGEESLFTVRELNFYTAQGPACIGDDTLFRVIPLYECGAEAVEGETRFQVELLVFVWVAQAWCRTEFPFHLIQALFLGFFPLIGLVLA